MREITRRMLQDFGYDVREAACGREALDRWRQNLQDIDLLLTDLIMPNGVNGRELAEQLRRQRPDLKVVFMSGWTGDNTGTDSTFFRKNNFVQKPCHADQLLAMIRKSLDAAAA